MICRRHIVLLYLLVLSLLLSGCGYQLRGQGLHALSSQMQTLSLQGVSVYSGFGRELADAIEAYGVRLVGNDEATDVVLRVKEPRRRRDVLSVDSSVYAREYSLVTGISFQLSAAREASEEDGRWQELEVRRDLVVNPNDVLGSDYEAERLQTEMDRELAERLVFRLRSQPVFDDR